MSTTPPDGVRRLLVLAARVPEHAQALSVAAVASAAGWLSGTLPLPASVLAWSGDGWLAYGWAALLGVSGLIVLAAAWARRAWLDVLTRLTVERVGHYLQASACLFYAAGALVLGRAGAWAAIAFGAWGVACAVRAVRAGREVRRITRAVADGKGG